ncbi:MAG: TonB-dependent receptor, partial [Pedobacter sp.]
MKSKIFALLLVLTCLSATAQKTKTQTFLFLDSITMLPVQGVTAIVHPQNISLSSSEAGTLSLPLLSSKSERLTVSAIGYQRKTILTSELRGSEKIVLSPQHTQLSEVIITSFSSNPNQPIGLTDIASRGVSNSQEILRMVPGLFISQHQGGGKAEQIFLRGYDNDHGKDIALSMDGMPINMVSHAHGQGYADSHFIIPEVIENINYKKGVFDAEKGDLAVSGWVDYKSRNSVDNLLKAEAGEFNTFRGLAMFNIFGEKLRSKGQHFYVASEYRYSDAYFENPQHFNRFNLFTKYNGKISSNSWLSLTASAFSTKWNASGQIPEGAVESGQVGYFGAIDPNEGGKTSRYNINAVIKTEFKNGSLWSNQVYYSRYLFDLFSNFTLFLNDEENGDEIRQRESRNLLGYNGVYKFSPRMGGLKTKGEAGLSSRFDFTNNTELSHTLNRYTLLQRVKLGDISE